jgi:DNA-binding transcriptional LysR family regulator
MNMQQLRYLVAVTDTGSMSAAARSLHVTQPVISRAIRSFETEHAISVFHLCGRRLVPTDAGRAVVESARRALSAIEGVAQTARTGSDRSELVIATTPTNGLLLLEALNDMGRSEPEIEVRHCRAHDADDLLHMVRSAAADIGFGDLGYLKGDSSLVEEPVADVEVVLVSPLGSDLPVAVTWEDIATHPLILPPTNSGRRQRLDDEITKAVGAPPQTPLVIEERSSWVAAAQSGMGSFLSFRPVAVRLEGIEIRPFKPAIRASVGFVFRPGPISHAARTLIHLARSSISGSPPLQA